MDTGSFKIMIKAYNCGSDFINENSSYLILTNICLHSFI